MTNIGHGIIHQMHNLHIMVSVYINDMFIITQWNGQNAHGMLQFSTWWIYSHNCMLRDWCNNILNCDCEQKYHFIVLDYRSWFGFSDIDSFCRIWFFSFLLSSLQFEFLSMSTYTEKKTWYLLTIPVESSVYRVNLPM